MMMMMMMMGMEETLEVIHLLPPLHLLQFLPLFQLDHLYFDE
jgi:hypothetical protein